MDSYKGNTTSSMLAEAIIITVRFVIMNHFYTFEDKIRRQAKGAALDFSLTAEM